MVVTVDDDRRLEEREVREERDGACAVVEHGHAPILVPSGRDSLAEGDDKAGTRRRSKNDRRTVADSAGGCSRWFER